jgi:hypothetical protein
MIALNDWTSAKAFCKPIAERGGNGAGDLL